MSSDIGIPPKITTVLLKRGEIAVLLPSDLNIIFNPYLTEFLHLDCNQVHDGQIYWNVYKAKITNKNILFFIKLELTQSQRLLRHASGTVYLL